MSGPEIKPQSRPETRPKPEAGPIGVARHVRIEGRVQGVWYRGWTVQEAMRRRLSGWVRNRSDGSVEALFAGPDAVVAEMVLLCWQGPDSARVTDVIARPADLPERSGFHALGTL
ncbi:MAG: acylphosphatase [Defluviicoccus sp.]|nr:MAG: acylphosphatase [Defluviicoccus sp.]